jgi:hypothetical protein
MKQFIRWTFLETIQLLLLIMVAVSTTSTEILTAIIVQLSGICFDGRRRTHKSSNFFIPAEIRWTHRIKWYSDRIRNNNNNNNFHGSTALVSLGLLTVEVSRTHSDTPHSVGLLWTNDQPVAETSTWQHTTLTRDRHPCPRRDSNPQSQ